MGQVAYKLDLSSQTKVHSVFQVSQLKCIKGTNPVTAHISTELTADLELQASTEAFSEILNHQFLSFHLEVNLWPAGNVIEPNDQPADPRPNQQGQIRNAYLIVLRDLEWQ